MIPNKEWFSPEEIAEMIGFAPATVRKLLKEDEIDVFRLTGRQLRVQRSDVVSFIRRRFGPISGIDD